ncbi:hypothetical protein F4804DRAFT_307238 [Jackrogersella minutella]|nr:hypothetical protein F4804DRAFT_307238 [Jackrogersella minutella]
MDGGNVNFVGAPNCQRVDLSRITGRDLLLHVAASLASLRDDFPDMFQHLEDVVQGESNDWKEILEDIGKNLQTIESTIDDLQEGQEGDDGVKSLLRTFEEQVLDLQAGQDRLAGEIRLHGNITRSRIEVLRESLEDGLDTKTKALHAEVQVLRRCFAATPRFSQFRKLPAEVRLMIWDLALPRRILCLEETDREYDERSFGSYKFASKSLPPAVAQVCRESRAVACQSGGLMSIRNARVYPETSSKKPLWCQPQWGWFDPNRDSLYLQPVTNHLRSLDAISDLTNCAKHITLDCGSTKAGFSEFFYCLFSPHHFPQLKGIDLVGAVYVQPERSDPVIETRVFKYGRDFPVCLDIDDEPAKSALMGRLETNHYSSNDVKRLAKFLAHAHRVPWSNLGRLGDQDWDEHLNYWGEEWLRFQFHRAPPTGKEEHDQLVSVGGEEKVWVSSNWVSMMLPDLPVIRRVALLRLDSWDK